MKKKLLVFITILCLTLSVSIPAFADTELEAVSPVLASADKLPYVVDDADLLDDFDEDLLEERLEEISADNAFDIVVVTTTELGDKSPMEYADDYYDYNGYGQGENNDGCLLLIHMDENRGYWISTTGYGITALTDYGIDYIGEEIVPYLSDGDYNEAFIVFADLVEEFVAQSNDGDPYDVYNKYDGDINDGGFEIKYFGYAIIIGLIAALIVVSILKAQLKSVSAKASASDYYVENSLVITGAQDIYVGSHVTRTERESSSSGGSSTHSGSSGTSHGGGGGSF